MEAIDPKDGKRVVVMFSYEKLQATARRSLGQIKEAALAVPEVLQHPTAIFEGLKRESDEPQKGRGAGLRCYCGIPRTAYRQDGQPCDPWPGQVLLVFVDTNMVVYNWYWYASDPDDPNLPEDHAVRFQERLL